MTDIKKLKKDIQYTPDEVYNLVSKAINYKSHPQENELIKNISQIGHSTEYKNYPEKLKHIIAQHDKHLTRNLLRLHKNPPEKIVTTSNIMYKIALDDLPMFLDYDAYEFLIQWRFEIKK